MRLIISELVLYRSNDGTVRLDVQFDQETIWLSLNQVSVLFGRDKSVISRHLRNIYLEGELDREATVAKNATVQTEAGRSVVRDIEYYNLDADISARKPLTGDEAALLLQTVSEYADALDLLDDYDHQRVTLGMPVCREPSNTFMAQVS